MAEGPPIGRFAFPAMLIGSASLAFGPWLVRLADVGPFSSGFWRLAIAAPVLLLLCALPRQPLPRPDRALAVAVLVAGAAFALDLIAWHTGILRTALANATLVGNTSGFALAAWGFLVARSLPGRNASIALMLAVAGVALLMGRSYQLSPRNLTGDMLCLLAAFLYTIYLIAVGNLRGRLSTLQTLALASAVGAPVAFAAAWWGEDKFWPGDWTPLLTLALTSQLLGQGLVVYAVAHLEPVVAGLCLLVQPLIAGAIGWIAYGERLGMVDFAGALMIAVALVLVRKPDRAGFPAGSDRLSASND